MTEPYRDPRRPTADRVEDLLDRMTLREKCFQLVGIAPWSLVEPDGGEPAALAETLRAAPGHVSGMQVEDPAMLRTLVATIQERMLTRTRLGIPALVHAEALNGLVSGGHTVFPTAIGLAATWSPDLVQEMADLIRRQMVRAGVRQALSPNLDLALDPRWGRVHESYGEDPYLSAALGVAFVRGLQGDDLGDGVVATAKHLIGYGVPEGGMNLSAYEGGVRRTRDLFAYPFEAAIQLASLRSVMNSYGTFDSVPVGASRAILQDLLRDTLGFDGFVSSDYSTLNHMVDRQLVARDAAEAARLGIAAGLDVEFPSVWAYGDVLAGEVEAGRVPVGQVDASVRRVLRAKFDLGLFEDPYPFERIDVEPQAGGDLSLELARRSVVLLENDGILPLAPGARLAVIGPHADAVTLQFPTYTYPALRDMLQVMSSGGFGNAVGVDPGMAAWNAATTSDRDPEAYVRETYGVRALAEELAAQSVSVTSAPGTGLLDGLGVGARAAAVDLARSADVAVLALGGASLWFTGARTEGEASDSADIALPAVQVDLARAVIATGVPVVLVLFQGRAYTLPEDLLAASALVVAPYGGPFGPRAVADVLLGAVEPTGHLAYSIPRHTGQIPIYHHQHAGTGYRNPLPPGVDRLYLDAEATPRFPFGRGIAYTTFEVIDGTSDPEMGTSGRAGIDVTVANTGRRSGAAVLQLYLRVGVTGVTRPAQQLAGFARVVLAAGERRRVRFVVEASQLGYTALDDRFVVEPAIVRWYVGLESDDRRVEGRIDMRGERRVLTSSDRSFLSVSTQHPA